MFEQLFLEADQEYEQGNFQKAFELFTKLANLNDSSAMSRIALMYAEGEGIQKNFQTSIDWDKKAIEAGNIWSLSNLAITYRTIGDILNSKKYFEKAIDAGDTDAVLGLAKLYMVSELERDKIIELLKSVTLSEEVTISCKEEALFLLSQYK